MTAMTDFLEAALISHVLRPGNPYTPPSNVYLGLFTSATADDGSGTEVVGGSYQRQPVTFDPPVNGVTQNANALAYANLPSGTLTHCAVFDAASGGNMLLHAALGGSRIVEAGETVNFSAGAVHVVLQ